MAASHLTKREDEIRRLVVDGLTNDAIASELGISARTVEAHLRMLFRKTGASRRDDLSSPPGGPSAGDGSDGRAVERLESQLGSYEAVLLRLIERQFSLFEERVEMTLTIGARPGEDMVVERHWTKPIPYLVYRVIRPITPLQTTFADVAALSMTCDVVDADVNAPVELVSDSRGRAQAVIIFQPGLQETTEWVLRYRTPGLWDPLRESGTDSLRWATGSLDGRFNASIHDLSVRFEFPSGAKDFSVLEGLGAGEIEPPGDTATTSVQFRDLSRTGAHYEWVLRMSWKGSEPGGSRA